jgi:hypothetical protein
MVGPELDAWGYHMSLADLFSFVSSSAVVVTLVFLFFQMRQANRNQRSLIQQARTARTVDLVLRQTEPYLSEVRARVRSGDPTIELKHIDTFVSHTAAMIWNYEDSFLQFQAGTLDPASWATDVATLKAIVADPACRVAWTINRNLLSGDYRDFVTSLVEATKAAPRVDLVAIWHTRMAKELSTT